MTTRATNLVCFDVPLAERGDPAPGSSRQRYDRSEQIKALFADGRTLTAAQVAATTGLRLAMTNRYLARLVAADQLVATAPPRSPKRAYRASS
jgi:Fic family protein